MGNDFLLENETARRLYHNYAAALPLVDYHCHISPKEIYENRRFNDLAEVWLGGKQPDGTFFGDHYKWRLMRANGVDERFITGDAPGAERVKKFAEALELAIGNPMYHWCNLELRRFFGIEEPLTPDNAREIYERCSKLLRSDPEFSVRGLIKKSNVAFIGTTDDPTSSLDWHKKIAGDPAIGVKVCPSFRPDKAINIAKPGFAAYVEKLAASVGKERLVSVQDVCDALTQRLEYFCSLGCRATDHGLDYIPFRPASAEETDRVYRKAMSGESLSREEAEIYQTALLLCLGRAYHRRGVVMQLHYSCDRNVNERMFRIMGPDTGYDMIGQNACAHGIAALLSALDETGECPKTILYSLNPADFHLLSSLTGCFQSDETPGKMQHGSAWWFNDTRNGMEAQMTSLADVGLLGNFVGMLTDSRSFLSYTRYEYFRRIFCNLVGKWVENGEYPDDEKALRRIVEGVCYRNAVQYFNL